MKTRRKAGLATHELAKDRSTRRTRKPPRRLPPPTSNETWWFVSEARCAADAAQLQQRQTRLAGLSRVTARGGVPVKAERVRGERRRFQEALRTIEGAAVELRPRHRDAAARCEGGCGAVAPARVAVGLRSG